MKVAIVTQHYAPHFEGGTEAVVRAQASALARLGHEVRIVSGTDRRNHDGAASEAVVDGLPVTFLHRRPDEPYDLILERPRLLRRVAALCAEADLVHVHHWTTLDNALVRTLSAGGRPVVVTLHDHFTSCPRFFRIPAGGVERCPEPGDTEPCVPCCAADAALPEDELRAGLRGRARAFRAELGAACCLIAPSRAHARALSGALGLPVERFTVVPHGLAAPLQRAAPPAGARPLAILHLGHRSRVKGTLDLVRALAGLPAERRGDVRLLCLGAELEPGFDRSLLDAAGGVRIDLEGPYDVAALSSLIAERGGAHLAAFPSRAPESYGLVVDEALALGLPCLVSAAGALPERLGGAGRVLPPADPAAWTAAVLAILEEPALLSAWRARLPSSPARADDAARALDDLYQRFLAARP